MQSRAELHDLAERFCAIYRTNPTLQRAHEQMVDDGMPASLILTPEQRKAGWAGKRLQPTRTMTFGDKKPAKEITDAGTARLLAEMRAKERAEAAAKAKRNAESRVIGLKKRTRTLALKAEVAKVNATKPVAIPAPTPEPAMPATPETPKETETMKRNPKLPATHPVNRGARRAQAATGKGSARRATKTAKTPKAAPAARANARKAVDTDGPRKGSKLETIAKLITRSGGCTAADVLKACDWKAVNMPRVAKAAGIAKLKTEKKDGVTVYSA